MAVDISKSAVSELECTLSKINVLALSRMSFILGSSGVRLKNMNVIKSRKGQSKWETITKGMLTIIQLLKPNLLNIVLELGEASISEPKKVD